MMKRVPANSNQSRLRKEKAVMNLRHHSLLHDYLELQKEFVSRKKKLRVANQRRETLLAEVRFLRQRLRYLQYEQSPEKSHTVPSQNSRISAKKLKCNVNEAIQRNHTSFLDSNSISGVVEKVGGMETETSVQKLKLKKQKKPKIGLINGQRAGKKKSSVRDQIVSKF